jgi:hypothetical protein
MENCCCCWRLLTKQVLVAAGLWSGYMEWVKWRDPGEPAASVQLTNCLPTNSTFFFLHAVRHVGVSTTSKGDPVPRCRQAAPWTHCREP